MRGLSVSHVCRPLSQSVPSGSVQGDVDGEYPNRDHEVGFEWIAKRSIEL